MALYGQQWISWLVLLITTGIAAGSSSAFSPDIAVGGVYMVLLLGPTVGWALFKGGASDYSLAAVVCVYGSYLWMQARIQSQTYWDKLIQSKLLSLRTSRTGRARRIPQGVN